MKVIKSSIIYENPLPQLRSRHSFFPNIAQLKDGTLVAVHVIGEAFESVDSKSYICFSRDGGESWSTSARIFDHGENEKIYTEYAKITSSGNNSIFIAFDCFNQLTYSIEYCNLSHIFT